MHIILDTTTGRPLPPGQVAQLPRGPVTVTLQLVTLGVAALLPEGQPVTLRFYRPADLETPLAELSEWERNSLQAVYVGTLNPLTTDLAWLSEPTLLARVSYGSPLVQSQYFHVAYGGSAVGAAATIPIVITQPSGPVTQNVLIGHMTGQLKTDQVEGFWRAIAASHVHGLSLNAQIAPTGADLVVELMIDGEPSGKMAALPAGQKSAYGAFDSPVQVAADEVLQFRCTQVGSAKAGSYLTVQGRVQLL